MDDEEYVIEITPTMDQLKRMVLTRMYDDDPVERSNETIGSLYKF